MFKNLISQFIFRISLYWIINFYVLSKPLLLENADMEMYFIYLEKKIRNSQPLNLDKNNRMN